MFTHPSLLRQLTRAAEHLRRSGEADWARRVVVAGDAIRKMGWTESGRQALQDLFEADPSLDSLSFGGAEHERRVGGPLGVRDANEALSEIRITLKELAALPLRAAIAPGTPRLRSPDLA